MLVEKLARGSLRLVRFVGRRERLRILIWSACLIGLTLAVPFAFEYMYSSDASSTEGLAVAMQNPAMIAMVGPAPQGVEYTVAVMNVHMMAVFMAIAIAIMNIFFVVRYTRRDEELGRLEMIGSLPVGHLSMLSATLIVAFLMNLLLGLGVGLGLAVLGIEGIDLAGSILYGMSLAAVGMVFVGVAAVAAQLSQTASGAIGLSMVFMIGSYLLRAVGDMGNEVLSYISPLGLVLRTEAAANNYWWPVFVMIAIAAVLIVKAFWLNAIRDMDQGLLPARRGRDRASKFLVRPMGLSLRLMRSTIVAWAIGLMLLGASYGSILGDVEAFSDVIAQVTGGSTEAVDFVSVLMMVLAICATIPCLMMLLRLRGEEKRGRLEGILAEPVSRKKIFRAYLVPALAASVVMPVVAVVGLWGAGAAVMDDPIKLGDMLWAVGVFLPAIWMMLGIAAVFIGIAPKRTVWVWVFLTFSFLTNYLGGMMGLPELVIQMTPFGHVPATLIESDVNYVPIIVTAVIAVVLLIVGAKTYQRRDMVE